MKLLEEEGVSFRRVNYFLEPLSKEDLVALLKKGGLGPRDLLRTREKSYKEMGLADPNLDDDVILDDVMLHRASHYTSHQSLSKSSESSSKTLFS